MDTYQMYCVKCRRQTESLNVEKIIAKNGRSMLRGTCKICEKTKTRFIASNAGGDLVDSLNSVTRNIKLPWAKYPGEMHLPGHSFTGPGTRLDLRLNPDGTFKESSKPIDRVDQAAYNHDLAYAAFPDIKNRNVADRTMVNELDDIKNPTLRERVERAIVKPILKTKSHFGLGLKEDDLKKAPKNDELGKKVQKKLK